jgi:CHAT domain-containing protein
VPPIEDDGIVTAEQVGGLKLNGAWLVVLSACETGSGEARAGEGVMGLRRGFIQASEQNLLMTLWPISDKATVQTCWISTKQRIRPTTHPKDRRQIEPWKV